MWGKVRNIRINLQETKQRSHHRSLPHQKSITPITAVSMTWECHNSIVSIQAKSAKIALCSQKSLKTNQELQILVKIHRQSLRCKISENRFPTFRSKNQSLNLKQRTQMALLKVRISHKERATSRGEIRRNSKNSWILRRLLRWIWGMIRSKIQV